MPPPATHKTEPDGRLEMRDFERAFRSLPAVQRDALSLVGISGFSYEETAAIVGCAEGTIKSRVCRARTELNRRLGRDDSDQDLAALKAAA
jgi:RNA polymerase sigma-70 factor, ECF subfamily